MTKSSVKKSTTGSLPPAVPLAITPTFSPWTHTSDDNYIYQLSLVLATATASFLHPPCLPVSLFSSKNFLQPVCIHRCSGKCPSYWERFPILDGGGHRKKCGWNEDDLWGKRLREVVHGCDWYCSYSSPIQVKMED